MTLTLPPVSEGQAISAPTVKGYHSLSYHVVTEANYTVLDDDGYEVILVTCGSADRALTLPTAADNAGRIIYFIKLDANTGDMDIYTEGSETIKGASVDLTNNSQYEGRGYMSDGVSQWYQVTDQGW